MNSFKLATILAFSDCAFSQSFYDWDIAGDEVWPKVSEKTWTAVSEPSISPYLDAIRSTG
jgi:hypothetical protein